MTLRELLQRRAPLVSPGCFDVLSALLVSQAGFECVSISGAAFTAAAMGLPDHSFSGPDELAQLVGRIGAVADIPVLVDCESGFGNALTAIRAADLMRRAGASCVCFQDKLPTGGLMVPEEMAALLRAVITSRKAEGMMLMARTDALGPEGMDAALARCRRYVDSGADLLFVNGVRTEREMDRLASAGLGVPLKFNNTIKEGGAQYSAEELYERGFQLIAYSASLQKAAIKAMRTVLAELRRTGKTLGCLPMAVSQQERAALLGEARWRRWQEESLAAAGKGL